MKMRIILIAFFLLLTAVSLFGCGSSQKSAALADKLRSDSELAASSAVVARVESNGVSKTVQGGYTDGRYHYQLFILKDIESNEEGNIVRLIKYDIESGKRVQISRALPLNHANDLTYDSARGVFVAVHNNPHRNRLSFIDPEPLAITETFEIDYKIYSISYNASKNLYVIGIAGGQSFRILDSDFKPVDDKVHQPTELTAGYTTQGAASDENFIYFVLYKQNVITVYDWDGSFVTLITLDVEGEPENLSVVDGVIYVATGYNGACSVYRIESLE